MKKKLIDISKISFYTMYASMRSRRMVKRREKKVLEAIKMYLKDNSTTKLHLGCGNNLLDGWLNTDLNPGEGAFFLDAGKKFPIVENSFNFIYSEHLIEHLRVEQQLNMLSEAYRILKKGGVFRIATPSLKFLIDLYSNPNQKINKDYLTWALKNIPNLNYVNKEIEVGKEEHIYVINNFFKAWGHQLIHNFTSLVSLGMKAGFRGYNKVEVDESQYFELKNIERHGTVIPPEFNKLETMIIEFVK